MAPTSSICSTSLLVARLASNSSACSSSSSGLALSASHLAQQQLRGFAGFVKPASSAPKKKPADGVDPENPRLKPLVTLLSSPERTEVPLTPEEEAAQAAYKRELRLETRAWERDMKVKFQLQQAALKALPERLRARAMQPDHSFFPLNRKFLYDTPPESYRDGSGAQAAKQGGR